MKGVFSGFVQTRIKPISFGTVKTGKKTGGKKHFGKNCQPCFSQLRDFINIRQFLTQDAAVSVANAFVSSRLDYYNSLFRSLSNVNLHRLQSIQNSAARIVTNSCKYTRTTPVLRKLHWLPIQFCSEFKLATLVYKFIHTGFPKYFCSTSTALKYHRCFLLLPLDNLFSYNTASHWSQFSQF